ncbi:MarR family winged helix-turn-helix transcriptional regulator [Allonocardiopsis opalescens]|uniref:MarR family transcriptional regulator n=1 Tax=Allonocardiopsis opalescens TaxID=1144618 RepID=A0A2T0Q5B0_9ACTN|nr:MarR family transcriptional regulator [Allonocardiopsis opalescens]PRX99008.1 MarR family transcriptional regulator [Allonocardiopsis opalescens]
MADSARTANLLGAAALALTDLALSDATRTAGVSTSAAAALVTLAADPGVSVTELGRRVGLTQSAAARMVDALVADDLVERRPTTGRWVTVHPTRAGRRAARRLLAARGGPLAEAVAALDDDDRQALAGLLAKLLARLYEQVGDAQYLCRLCDRAACTANASCPVGAAERRDRAAREEAPTTEP